KKWSKFSSRALLRILRKHHFFNISVKKGFCEQLFHVLRTSATTVAHLPGPSSLSNNTMRDTFVFSSRAHAEIFKNQWVS
ncbi:MAG: hypothetical protein VXZ13_16525, partial [Pseudomonadota bacterium]|nr:hypothetical protein [Pseudomonadota bacterium]